MFKIILEKYLNCSNEPFLNGGHETTFLECFIVILKNYTQMTILFLFDYKLPTLAMDTLKCVRF